MGTGSELSMPCSSGWFVFIRFALFWLEFPECNATNLLSTIKAIMAARRSSGTNEVGGCWTSCSLGTGVGVGVGTAVLFAPADVLIEFSGVFQQVLLRS